MSYPAAKNELPALVTTLTRQRTPVIVTFGKRSEVVDTFGEVLYYADTKEHLVELLSDLLVGGEDCLDTLAEVRMPSGRYADVRVVPEGGLRHVILFDTTETALERRAALQTSHELALAERQGRVTLERHGRLSAAKRDANVIELLSCNLRAHVDEIRGHASSLEEAPAESSAAGHSISCIKRASLHLDAYLSVCIAALRKNGRDAYDPLVCEPIDIRALVKELQGRFEGDSRLHFELECRLHGPSVVWLVYAKFYDAIVCLISCLQDAAKRRLTAKFCAEEGRLVVEILADIGPFQDEAHHESLQRWLLDDPRYLLSHQLVVALGGLLVVQTDSRNEGVWLGVPCISAPSQTQRSEQCQGPRPSTVLVLVDQPVLSERIAMQLSSLGLSARHCDDLNAIEREAIDPSVAMIILAESLMGSADLVALLRHKDLRLPLLVLRQEVEWQPVAWVLQEGRVLLSIEADDETLRLAIETALLT